MAADGAIWFTDPTFGLLMPNQGSIVTPELDHRSVYRFAPKTGELRSLGEIIGGHAQDTHEVIAFETAADHQAVQRHVVVPSPSISWKPTQSRGSSTAMACTVPKPSSMSRPFRHAPT